MLWEEIIDRSKMEQANTKQIFQEEMQKVILTAFSRKGCFNNLVFQGGTALRLFYGNPRFSEDIDLVLKHGENAVDLTSLLPKIQNFVYDVFPFLKTVTITTQKNTQEMQRFILKTQSDTPAQKVRIHIKLAYIPSYYNQPRILHFPPLQPAVRVEELQEILADKVIALGGRSYLKGRDIWDIYFLIVEKHVTIPWDLVLKKAEGHNYTPSAFEEKLLKARTKINKDGMTVLSNELKRFLPKPLLEQYSSMFPKIVARVTQEVGAIEKMKEQQRR